MKKDKETYLQKQRTVLNEWRSRVSQIEGKAGNSETLASSDLKELQDAEKKVQQLFERLQSDHDDGWAANKLSLENALESLKRLVQEKYVEIDQ